MGVDQDKENNAVLNDHLHMVGNKVVRKHNIVPLNFCLTWAAMPSSEPLNHWNSEPPCIHSYSAHIELLETLQGLDSRGFEGVRVWVDF